MDFLKESLEVGMIWSQLKGHEKTPELIISTSMCRQQRPCILSANLGEIKLVNCCVTLSWCLDPKFWISTNNHKLNLFVAVSTLLLFLSLSSQITQSFLFLRVVVRNHFLILLSVKHLSKIFFKSGAGSHCWPLATNINIIQNGVFWNLKLPTQRGIWQLPRPGNPFGPENAIDGEESTFWMPAQVPQEGVPNFITLDMTCLGETKKWQNG